ncbi:TIGR04141 family sporadically distributed protein [Rhodovibrio salinarum]|uniref:TIGR04141 family sporadically distributed protein n=1 Tax=Rhodovibrio salinarum TaxID=1087 RepID=UPI002ADDDCDC|nr:TIGR04141 family sporadically distributed protein [Rhodovibrio salinarum]
MDHTATVDCTPRRRLRSPGEKSGLASEALEFFHSNYYQSTNFRIIDVVTPIADRRKVDFLDGLAAERIRNGHADFELGLPASYEDEGVAYAFCGPGLRGRHPDLLLSHYTAAMGEQLPTLDAQKLKSHKVVAIYEDGARPKQRWAIRTALVGSIIYDGDLYAINEGEWYQVDEAYKQSIEDSFWALKSEWEGEPPPPLRKIYDEGGRNGKYQNEALYNQELAEQYGYILLDQKEVRIEDVQRSGFEPCDLLDIEGKRFIHVKKSSRRSSILSHFFKQGANSAQQFRRFPSAMTSLEALVRRTAGNNAADRLIEAHNDDHRNWSVEFWIADNPRATGEFNIPFFSKISLRDEASSLEAMEYQVTVRFICLDTRII